MFQKSPPFFQPYISFERVQIKRFTSEIVNTNKRFRFIYLNQLCLIGESSNISSSAKETSISSSWQCRIDFSAHHVISVPKGYYFKWASSLEISPFLTVLAKRPSRSCLDLVQKGLRLYNLNELLPRSEENVIHASGHFLTCINLNHIYIGLHNVIFNLLNKNFKNPYLYKKSV